MFKSSSVGHLENIENIWGSLICLTFLHPPSTINQNDSLTSLPVYNALGVCKITCLSTCKEPARHAIITCLCFVYAET